MKTWTDIVDELQNYPQYIELTITLPTGEDEIVNGILLDGVRVDYDTIPTGFFPYAIRHKDDDWCEPGTLEKYVMVNFLGTILLDHEIDLGESGWLEIEDYCYKDWRDVAFEELTAVGVNIEYSEYWSNLESIKSNVCRLKKQQLEDEQLQS